MDTPGIHKPQDGLGSFMNTNALNSIYGVDLVLFLAPADEKIGKGDRFIVERLKAALTEIAVVDFTQAA
jgi:GTP-binding protein Era